MLHQKAGYISARPTSSSQKASCDARPVHTSGSTSASIGGGRECPGCSRAVIRCRLGIGPGFAVPTMCSALDNRVSRGRYLAGVYVPAADFHFILIDYHFRSHPSFRVFAWNAMHPSDRLHHRLLIAVRTCEYYGNASIAIFGEGSIVPETCIMRQQNSLLTPCERENLLVAA